MATGRVTRVRSVAVAPGRGRVTKVRSRSVSGVTGRVTRVRSVTSGTATVDIAAQPYDVVNLGAGSWTQTSGITVTPPIYTAPAAKGGDVETFSSGGNIETVTVAPHTMFRITTAGLVGYRTTNL